MRKLFSPGFLLICALAYLAVSVRAMYSEESLGANSEPRYGYEVINSFPHDPGAFTQGLVYHDGYLYEGTGLHGSSSLRKVRLEDGSIAKEVDLPRRFFGEGIAIYGDKIIQLTWQEQQGFVYDRESFALVDNFSYHTEGWGITTDGEYLIMSDGTPVLTYLDPTTFRPVRKITVRSLEGPVARLNELEYIKGEIWANVWMTDLIVRIDPSTGHVTGWIDLAGLLDPAHRQSRNVDVLNGIAYDQDRDRLFVTGKLWPRVYEIRLIPHR
ncbi:MAG: glutaminyl-peptide cyclotransferase [Firmicutes bacterium]|nr:glutaminyl-peptide cyclotransferase [Bacillota bacterium]